MKNQILLRNVQCYKYAKVWTDVYCLGLKNG